MKKIFKFSSCLAVCIFLKPAEVFSKKADSALTIEQKLNKLAEENHRLQAQLSQLQQEFALYKQTQPTPMPTKTDAISVLSSSAPVHRTSADKLKLTLGGHANRVVAYYDTRRRAEVKHLDNNASSTRLTLTATGQASKDIKIGGIIEGELTGNNTKNHDLGQPANLSNFQERKLEGYLETSYGQVWAGQGETAAHRVADVDLSGTSAISDGAEFQSFAGGVSFVKGAVLETQQGGSVKDRDRQVAQVYSEVLGSSRKNRLKYVSPSFKGFTLEVSHAMRDYTDMGLRYGATLKDTKIVAAAGYIHNPFNTNANASSSTSQLGRQEYGGSIAVLFSSGFSLRASHAQRRYAHRFRKTGSAWSAKVGYQHTFLEMGKTYFALTYGEGRALFDSRPPSGIPTTSFSFLEDNNEKIRIWGLYLVQMIDQLSTEAYLGYQHHRLYRPAFNTVTGAGLEPYNFHPIQAVLMGARIKF